MPKDKHPIKSAHQILKEMWESKKPENIIAYRKELWEKYCDNKITVDEYMEAIGVNNG